MILNSNYLIQRHYTFKKNINMILLNYLINYEYCSLNIQNIMQHATKNVLQNIILYENYKLNPINVFNISF